MPNDAGATWSQRLVPVPVWSLMLLGAAMVGGGGVAGVMTQRAEAGEALRPSDISEIRASLNRIEGTLDGVVRIQAAQQSSLDSLRRDLNGVRADVDVLQRGRR